MAAKKIFTIEVPTVGYQAWEVKAKTAEEAIEILREIGNYTRPSKNSPARCVEESSGDWADGSDWEIDEGEDDDEEEDGGRSVQACGE